MSVVSRSRSPLAIAELFYNVLDFLAEPSADGRARGARTPDRGGQVALATLARTCRGFKEPSLDYLWRKINSLKPILRLFNSRYNFNGIHHYLWVRQLPYQNCDSL